MAALTTHYHYAMATADREARVVRELLNGAYISARDNACTYTVKNVFFRMRVQ